MRSRGEAFAALRQILYDAPPLDAFAWLPRQVIHGDFYPPNLLCDASGIPIAVLDWEFATIRPRIWDIARAIAFSFLGVHGDPADFAAAQRCIAAYRAILPLPDDELTAGIALYLWRTAHNLAKYRWHDERGPQPTDALAPGDLALVRWLHQHGDALVRYLAGGPTRPLRSRSGMIGQRINCHDRHWCALELLRRDHAPPQFLVQPACALGIEIEPRDAQRRCQLHDAPHERACHPGPSRGGRDVDTGKPRRQFRVRRHIVRDQTGRSERVVAVERDEGSRDAVGVGLRADISDARRE